MYENNHPSYDLKPIGSIQALSRVLGIESSKLTQLADEADRLYRGPILVKKKGKIRTTFDARPELKKVHERILRRILDRIVAPAYLMGGLRDPERKRGYVRNATRHSGAALLVGEDIADFFPSIPISRVRRIFLHVFHFPPAVATLLARLCTRLGIVPQGAKTSTAIANLALYDVEPTIVEKLARKNITYTRLIDDANASTHRRLSRANRTDLVKTLRSNFELAGFRPKRTKQIVTHKGKRMTVNGLNVNGVASRDRASRKNLRYELFMLEKMVKSGQTMADFDARYRRLASKIGTLKLTNAQSASALRKQLMAIGALRPPRQVLR